MTDTASLEQALRAALDRLIESRLGSLRQELAKEFESQVASAVAGFQGGSAPAPIGSGPATASLAELNRSIAAILDRKSTRLNSSHIQKSRMPSSA